ncbi:hypothetical protein [Methylobacterium gnaphalii]|uniref:Uncharacterized protein n=1 Tax=Methylobacterium gnaphalii TaxID=1010610 RepID=A0A512JNY9_9HYPH|nr:hypothetical protein [Methylobacterium gnaphalii]GEP11671.1 hypothetical protein MGN01_35160 [Methylobacterium gnaphalii]GJD71353.1 hypothetical protein MMMDOFMJ_4309 [Methylobacterium gnaphalii]GLS50169.1 hypothetical protein GCM10007885_30210 [Methylobacterium gnaphalii]
MTNAQMARAFNEWMRRFIEEPDQFAREFEEVNRYLTDQGDGREPTYGETCTAYLHELSKQLPAS